MSIILNTLGEDILVPPISITEVANVLGVGSSDLGTICRHTNINPWAKYKPVCRSKKLNTDGTWDYDSFKGNGGWSGEDGSNSWFYGDKGNATRVFYIPSIGDNWDLIKNGNDKWVYNRPSGGNFAFRLTDFLGYNNRAYPSIVPHMDSSIRLNSYFNIEIRLGDDYATRANGNITIEDIKHILDVQHIYLGMRVVNLTKNTSYIYVLQDELSLQNDDSYSVSFFTGDGYLSLFSGGRLQKMRMSANDELEFYMFITDEKNEDDDGTDKWGINTSNLASNAVTYRKLRVGAATGTGGVPPQANQYIDYTFNITSLGRNTAGVVYNWFPEDTDPEITLVEAIEYIGQISATLTASGNSNTSTRKAYADACFDLTFSNGQTLQLVYPKALTIRNQSWMVGFTRSFSQIPLENAEVDYFRKLNSYGQPDRTSLVQDQGKIFVPRKVVYDNDGRVPRNSTVTRCMFSLKLRFEQNNETYPYLIPRGTSNSIQLI